MKRLNVSAIAMIGIVIAFLSCGKDDNSTNPPDDNPNKCLIAWERGNPTPDWQWDLAIISCDGSGFNQLTTTGYARWPTWRPDGQKLLWIKELPQDCDELWVMNVDGSGKQLIYSGDSPCLKDHDHKWSPDGNRIALNAEDGLYMIAASGGATTKIVDVIDDDFSRVEWKHDGSKLAFTAWAGGRIIVCNPDGQEAHNISPYSNEGAAKLIGWKGTSDTIIFVISQPYPAEIDSLASIRMDGSGYRSWVQCDYESSDIDVDNIAINRAGDRVVYERAGQAYVLNFMTGTEQAIPVPYGTQHVDISSDGEWIAVVSNGNTDADLILFHFDGSGLTNITNTPNFKEKGPRFRPIP